MIEGEECRLSVWSGGKLRITCDLLAGKEFDSEEKIESAIKAYNLLLRKDFTNKTAYIFERRYGQKESAVIEVEVTSIVDDKEAWIKANGRRMKANRASIYTSRREVQAALDVEAKCNAEIRAAWDAVERWQPLKRR